MFGIFLKKKLEIETKLNYLEKFYLDLLGLPILPIVSETKSLEKATEILKNKLETLNKIKEEYTEVLDVYEKFSKELTEAKVDLNELELELDNIFGCLELDIPKHLIKESECEEQEPLEQTSEDSEKENSVIQEEEYFIADKDFLEKSYSEEYFSPNVQILKSGRIANSGTYTPAVKSLSKKKFHFNA